MDYKLSITRVERNPKYRGPTASPYHPEEPEYSVMENALDVTLNEEEFKAIKKAVIEVIK